ncbi:MAG: TonB-dependent receptor [Brevundimonas sp. 32-68-21]|jgi:iron complex outermembrane receptor protein|nr:TonB-dependent receptor domain protein [Brevundimonas sp. BAL3]OYX81607.1 MAG: TonB-dependent receptor [Brevundimonas sp. 32-68-21]
MSDRRKHFVSLVRVAPALFSFQGIQMPFKHAAFASAAVSVMMVAGAAQAQAQYAFDLPAQSLERSLTAVGRQTQVNVVFRPEQVSGKTAEALKGRFTADAALRRLLAGSGLDVRTTPGGSYLLVEAPTQLVQTESAVVDDVVVLGRGRTRQMQTLSKAELDKLAPGTSPLAALNKLPGVNFTSSDPFGAYEWAQQVTIRSFTTDQMGYTLDGLPLGNMQYRNNNGLSIGRALLTENNGATSLSQGGGALGTASTNNIGGTIDFTSIDPTGEFGVDMAGTYGSGGTWRGFTRLNTGRLPGGGSLYAAYARQDTKKWKAAGEQNIEQINVKFVQPLGEAVRSTTFLDYADRREDDYADLSFALVNRLGWNVDTISDNFPLAEALATALQTGGAVPAPYLNADDVYYNGGGVRQDTLVYERLDYDLTPSLSGSTTAYYHRDHGIGTYASPYDATPEAYGGSPVSVSALRYDIDRAGLISRLSYTLGDHKLDAGVWYEDNDFHQAAYLYGLTKGVAPTNFQRFYDNPFRTRWDYQFTTKTYQFHVGDTWSVTDNLKVNAGFKALNVTNEAETITSNTPINGVIKARDYFLPSAGILYRLDERNEMFASFTRNMAAFVASASSGPFSTTQAGFDYIRKDLKPEKTRTLEAGYRYSRDGLLASVTAYDVAFENRLLATSISATIVGNQNVLQNVGGVTSRGVETAISWRFAPAWSLFGSFAYNDAKYDDDVTPLGGATIATKGKRVVAAPKTVGGAELAYDNGTVWSKVTAHYQGERFYTYLNDSPVKSSTVFDLAAGYRVPQTSVEVLLNVTNLFDKRYYSSVGTSGFVNADPTGSYTTLQQGAPRQVFATVRVSF